MAKPKDWTLGQNEKEQIVKMGAVGALLFSGYQFLMVNTTSNLEKQKQIQQPVESLHVDGRITDALLGLQKYKELETYLFTTSVSHIDSLLFLEQQLLRETITPTANDRAMAFHHFRVAINRLQKFHQVIYERLDAPNAVVAAQFIKQIYDRLQEHYRNIYTLCSNVKAHHILQRAPQVVQNALHQLETRQR